MPTLRAGCLMYRRRDGRVEVFLVHPGGPFWKNKDEGAWTIPKGEIDEGEDVLVAANREFAEEIGLEPAGDVVELTPVRQRGGKVVHAWAVAGDIDREAIESNTFEIEWPPRSGRMQSFPEVDRAAWFAPDEAKRKINPAQAAITDEQLEQFENR